MPAAGVLPLFIRHFWNVAGIDFAIGRSRQQLQFGSIRFRQPGRGFRRGEHFRGHIILFIAAFNGAFGLPRSMEER